ncbi:uncharacterized protein LOC135121254 [Zophobas morio]|uniref:uncharacterized protein LOC135121254 n=1 Tax=Zophobas morio TaxID=2755281 RepID=UPI003083641A
MLRTLTPSKDATYWKLCEEFKDADENNDGYISKEEFSLATEKNYHLKKYLTQVERVVSNTKHFIDERVEKITKQKLGSIFIAGSDSFSFFGKRKFREKICFFQTSEKSLYFYSNMSSFRKREKPKFCLDLEKYSITYKAASEHSSERANFEIGKKFLEARSNAELSAWAKLFDSAGLKIEKN